MKRFSKEIQKLPKVTNCVRVFTDGSCYPNPGGFGGWAFVVQPQDGQDEYVGSGGELSTTNNRMELMAVIKALESIKVYHTIELVTDSEYVGKGISLWMAGWQRTGWRQKNSDLWKILYELVHSHDVYVTCIRGHQGQKENEECDRMAGEAAAVLRNSK